MRRLALLCLAVATLTPVAVAVPPLLDHAAADQVPRSVPPGVTATAFAGIARASGTPALAAARVAAGGPRVAALTGELSRPHFGAVGVTWTGSTPAGTAVEVRLREKFGWSGWQALPPADGGGPDQGTAEARTALHGTEPLLTDGADGVQVRVSSASGAAPSGLKVQTVDRGAAPAGNAPGPSSFAASPAAFVPPAATVGAAARPAIISRAQWGADESLRRCAPVYLPSIKAAVLHHTAGSNTYSAAGAAVEIQSDYRYHTQVLGWCDLGYNFVVDRFGRIYEGRAGGVDRLVQGAHAIGVNGETFGVAALGNFDVAQPPAAMTTAITQLVAWKLGLSHIDPRAATTLTSAGNERFAVGAKIPVYGLTSHRDTWYTACPGQYLYAKMASLRSATAALMTGGSQPPPSTTPTGKYAAYDKVVLQVGSTGSAVKVLQAALKVTPVDGDFGPLTKAKVVAYQKSRKLSATGIVTSPVWRALSADASRRRSPRRSPRRSRRRSRRPSRFRR